MNHMTYPLSSADISIFSSQISKFCYVRKYKYTLHFEHIISNSFDFFWVFKELFDKQGCNFDDVSKIGYFRPS